MLFIFGGEYLDIKLNLIVAEFSSTFALTIRTETVKILPKIVLTIQLYSEYLGFKKENLQQYKKSKR